jgi:hypothetical protein
MTQHAIANITRYCAGPIFKPCHLRPKFQVDHLPHLEASVCFRRTAPLFVQKRGQAETEFVRVRRRNHGSGGRKYDEDRGVPSWLCRLLTGTSLHRIPDYVGVTPASCRVPPFKTGLNTFPSLTPECQTQASTSSLHRDGTGTVRSRPPLPTKSTITQWLSLDCSWLSLKPATSERRNPHPSSNPRIAPSLQPRRFVFEAAFTRSCA